MDISNHSHHIKLQSLNNTVPEGTEITLINYFRNNVHCMCLRICTDRQLTQQQFDQCIQWQRQILLDNFMETYIEVPGRVWRIYLTNKTVPIIIDL